MDQQTQSKVKNSTSFHLAPGEKDVFGESFMPSLATPYLKTQLMCSSTRFVYKAPNTLLGLIPLGAEENILPIRNIASVSTNSRFFPLRAIAGLILLISGLLSLNNILLGIVLMLIGALMLLTSFPGQLKVTNPAGGTTSIIVSCLDKKKLAHFAQELQNRVFADQEAIRHDEAQALRMTQAQLQQMQLAQQQLANQIALGKQDPSNQ